MTKLINGTALTEKKVLKPVIRETIKAKDLEAIKESLADYGFEIVEEKGCLLLTRVDTNGTEVYTTLTLTVGTKHPCDKAERKHTTSKKETEEIIIE